MTFVIRLDKGDYLAEDYEFQSALACTCNCDDAPCPVESCPFQDKDCSEINRQDWEDFLTKELFPSCEISSYGKGQEEWVRKNDIKTGTTVRVIRKAESHELGWCNNWLPEMDACVGKTGWADLIEGFGDYGIEVHFDNDNACASELSFPYFVLEKVEG